MNTSDLIADLESFGLSRAEAWELLSELDRLTANRTRADSAEILGQLVARAVARRRRLSDGREQLVPTGFVRT